MQHTAGGQAGGGSSVVSDWLCQLGFIPYLPERKEATPLATIELVSNSKQAHTRSARDGLCKKKC